MGGGVRHLASVDVLQASSAAAKRASVKQRAVRRHTPSQAVNTRDGCAPPTPTRRSVNNDF